MQNRRSLFTLSFSLVASLAWCEVPEAVDANLVNYQKIRHNIASSGAIKSDADLETLKVLGFKTIIDLRTQEEGINNERIAAEHLGLNYINIPVGGDLPTQEQVRLFGLLLKENATNDTLVHCASGNRVGLLWAQHLIEQGIAKDKALSEGRNIGMRSAREEQLLQSLGKK